MKVADQYRTNKLSLKPGGHSVTITYADGKSYEYDKVKKPNAYVKKVMKTDKAVIEVLVDNVSVWQEGKDATKPWSFKMKTYTQPTLL